MAGYIGSKASVVSSGVENKKVITATAGQTSFTGLTYSPNRVHVFQNGVRLVDGTDYTATDGNSLTLTVGALADDQVVVVSYSGFQTSDTVSSSAGGTFTGDVNFTGAFTSQGIDDNATSTAMTLDASGNLLVGKTSTAFNTAGFELFGNADKGKFWATRDGGVAAAFNRKTSDGDIALFAKDGSTVGSIGTVDSQTSGEKALYIGTSSSTTLDVGLIFDCGPNEIHPSDANGVARDAAINLGGDNERFKNIYLSGGAYLGGTGSSNKLDDYEEGTWTPTCAQASITAHASRYTKTGNMVHLQAYIGISSPSASFMLIGGLPFAVPSHGWSPAILNKGAGTGTVYIRAYAVSSTLDLKYADDSAVPANAIGSFMTFQLSYPVS
jgi:hypothetical protein